MPFQVGVETVSADLRMSLVARGYGIGIVTPAAFAGSPWRDAVEVIDVPDFKPRGAHASCIAPQQAVSRVQLPSLPRPLSKA